MHVQERETTVETGHVPLPIVPLFPEMLQQEMSVVDSSATVVFCSPRNGRGSPRSSQRQLSESDQQIRPPLSPENDASLSDASQNARLSPSVSEALITASSCSSCWVQFSQTDRDYIDSLTAKFLFAFCDPHPPEVLRSTELPIPLRVFTSIQRDCANSYVQEAFDRAIFDTVNTRLVEIYECLGRLKVSSFVCFIPLCLARRRVLCSRLKMRPRINDMYRSYLLMLVFWKVFRNAFSTRQTAMPILWHRIPVKNTSSIA